MPSMGDMPDDMDMGSMAMTFSNLGAYKVKILWGWWDVQTRWEFFFSACAVVMLCLLYHAVRRTQGRMLRELISAAKHPSAAPSEELGGLTSPLIGSHKSNNGAIASSSSSSGATGSRAGKGLRVKRLKYAATAAVGYALALLLMLIAMTYNSGLFLVLVFGYFLGEFLLCEGSSVPMLRLDHCH